MFPFSGSPINSKFWGLIDVCVKSEKIEIDFTLLSISSMPHYLSYEHLQTRCASDFGKTQKMEAVIRSFWLYHQKLDTDTIDDHECNLDEYRATTANETINHTHLLWDCMIETMGMIQFEIWSESDFAYYMDDHWYAVLNDAPHIEKALERFVSIVKQRCKREPEDQPE